MIIELLIAGAALGGGYAWTKSFVAGACAS